MVVIADQQCLYVAAPNNRSKGDGKVDVSERKIMRWAMFAIEK